MVFASSRKIPGGRALAAPPEATSSDHSAEGRPMGGPQRLSAHECPHILQEQELEEARDQRAQIKHLTFALFAPFGMG